LQRLSKQLAYLEQSRVVRRARRDYSIH
jgi:hypothetical protein